MKKVKTEKPSKTKLLTLFLAVQLILGQFLISCANESADGNEEGGNIGVTNADGGSDTATEPTTEEELYEYPEHDFGGAVIRILARKDGWADGSQDFDDLYVESETGEVFNDAVYHRTQKVEDKYNMKLEVVYIADPAPTISKSVKAGDDEYQLVQDKLIALSANLATQDLLYDFKNVSSMNLDAPWYNQNAINDLSINNKITALGGDMTVSDKAGVIMTVFNKNLVVQYGLENLYNLVNEGKWTLDKLHELMMQVTVDLNGDGTYTIEDDQWGLAMEDYGGWMFSIASGNRLASLDENGIPYMTCATEKNINDYSRIMKIMYEKQGRAIATTPEIHESVFIENRCLFSIGMLSQFTALRSMQEDFGIIPLPKQDEVQKEYITTISPWVSRFLAMPLTCGNPEMVGAVIDAMSRESTNTIAAAYYDNLLNQKIARDEESIEMLQLIFSSTVYDIGSVFNWGGIWDKQAEFIGSENENYLGFYEKYQGAVEAALARTVEAMAGQQN